MTGVAMISHGGMCCGVTHLYLGGSGPDEMQDEMKRFDYKDLKGTGLYTKVTFTQAPTSVGFSQNMNYEAPAFSLVRPRETAKERAGALLDRAKGFRNSGIIEAVTTDYQKDSGWGEFLTERGFTMVSETVNSNSDNTIQVWLLATNPDYDMEPEDDSISGTDYPDELEEGDEV